MRLDDLYHSLMDINETVAKWVREARKSADLSGEQLGARLAIELKATRGYSKGNISHWELGKHQPSLEQLLAISRVTGAALPDEILRATNATIGAQQFGYRTAGESGDRRQAASRAEQPLGSYVIDPTRFKGVPVIGRGTGGITNRDRDDGGYDVGTSDKYGEVATSDPNAFLVEIDEMSMYPKYTPGDFALVEPNTGIDLEDDVLVKFNDYGPIVKRLLSRKGGFVRLGSYNTQEVVTRADEDVVWMYYVAYPVPAKKIKNRI